MKILRIIFQREDILRKKDTKLKARPQKTTFIYSRFSKKNKMLRGKVEGRIKKIEEAREKLFKHLYGKSDFWGRTNREMGDLNRILASFPRTEKELLEKNLRLKHNIFVKKKN